MRRGQFTTILEVIRGDERPEQDFALVLNAPPEVAQGIDDVRRRYDPAFKENILPHITVKRPAPLGGMEKVPQVRFVLREALQSFPALSVQLQGYGIFRSPNRNVAFLKVADEKPFCELHSRVLEGLGRLYPGGLADRYEGENYHPHLTIGNELSDLDLAVLEHELSSGLFQLDFNFRLDQVALFVHQPGQPWQIVELFEFKVEE